MKASSKNNMEVGAKYKMDIGEQFLNDMGIDTDMVERVVIVFKPGNSIVANVTRLVRLDHDRLETVKEKYELVRRVVEDEQENQGSLKRISTRSKL